MGKYDKHFIFQDKPNVKLAKFQAEIPSERGYRIVYLDSEVFPNADFYVETLWFWPGERPRSKPGIKSHTHPFDEVIGFFGTNPDDIHDLCGEIELWIDGKQHIIDKSFMAFVPAGIVHCPLFIRRIDRPIFHFTAGNGKMYE
jgi:hypothetical protein